MPHGRGPSPARPVVRHEAHPERRPGLVHPVRIPCPQCGGEVTVREAEGFPACSFCGSSLILDLTGVHSHFLYRPRVGATEVLPLIRRWADQYGQAVPAGSVSPRLVYYPFWRYVREGPRRLVPAWSTLEDAWGALSPPDAEQLFFDPAFLRGAEVIEPTIPDAAARQRAFGGGESRAGDLVRLPVYETMIRVGQREVRVAVEACSGIVVCAGEWVSDGGGIGRRRTGWLLGGGLLMLGAALAIRPWGIAALAVGILGILWYGVLVGAGRGRRA